MVTPDEVLDLQIGLSFRVEELLNRGLVALSDGPFYLLARGAEAGAPQQVGSSDGFGVGEGDALGVLYEGHVNRPGALHQAPTGVGVDLLAQVVDQPGANLFGHVEGGFDELGFVGNNALLNTAGSDVGAGHHADADP